MKKRISILATIIIIVTSLISCDRELEYSSDFNFEIKNIDDTEIFINTLKSFQLEITELKNVDFNKEYSFSYSVSNGNLTVKDGANTLIKNNKYNFTVNELNLISLDLIPQSAGQITVEFTLTDNNGVSKKKEVIVFCTDIDFSYTFTGNVPNPNGTVNNPIPFGLNVTNTGQSANSFQLKYISTGTGTITINGNVMPQNQYFNVSAGIIQGLFNSSDVGNQTVTLTCKDANNQELQVILNFSFTATPFSLAKINDFSVKNTLKSDFKFTLTNTTLTATYQIKFTSINPAKIFLNTTQVNMNTWVPITISLGNLYTFKYECNSDTNDVLSVEVKDSYGQTQAINYNVTVFSKPIINNFNIIFNRTTPTYTAANWWTCNGTTTSNILNTITGGAALTKTKIVIKNKITGAFDTIEFNNSNIQNVLETINTISNSTSPLALTSCINMSKYAGQLYSIQIQDSDGVWSAVSNSTVVNQ